ncbi:hypothetical protein DV736_g403, partial [Chaetothyriales sp. CBS 134916]
MTGRGKGGKGLGKGGAKRHRKILRDNIQGITKPAIRRLARRGGVKRISAMIYEETRGVLKSFLESVIRDAVTYTEHAKRKTVTSLDVVYALKRQGRTLIKDPRISMSFFQRAHASRMAGFNAAAAGGGGTPLQRLTKLYQDTKQSYESNKPMAQPTIGGASGVLDDPDVRELRRDFQIEQDRLLAWGMHWADVGAQTGSGAGSGHAPTGFGSEKGGSGGGLGEERDIDKKIDQAGLGEVVASVMSQIKSLLDESGRLQHPANFEKGKGNVGGIAGEVKRKEWTRHEVQTGRLLLARLTECIDLLYSLSEGQTDEKEVKSEKKAKGEKRERGKKGARGLEDDVEAALYGPQQRQSSALGNIKEHPLYVEFSQIDFQTQYSGDTAEPPPYYGAGEMVTGGRGRVVGFWRDAKKPVLIDFLPTKCPPLVVATSDDVFEMHELGERLKKHSQNLSFYGHLRVLGFTVETYRCGMVYELPDHDQQTLQKFQTLSAVIDATSNQELAKPPLENRFRLAYNILISVLGYLANGDSHRDVSSNNVILIPEAEERPQFSAGTPVKKVDIRSGFLLQSCQDFVPGDASPEPLESEMYRHPEYELKMPGSIVPAFDIYSLGLVLLEIGLWVPLSRMWKLDYDRRIFMVRIQRMYSQKLASKMGSKYMRLVQRCLHAPTELLGKNEPHHAATHLLEIAKELRLCLALDEGGVPPGDDLESFELLAIEQMCKTEANSRTADHASLPPLHIPGAYTEPRETVILQGDYVRTRRKLVPVPSAENSEPTQPQRRISKRERRRSAGTALRKWPEFPVSQADLDIWNTMLMPRLSKILQEALQDSPESASVSLLKIGATAENAKTTICVQCHNTARVHDILRERFRPKRGWGLVILKGDVRRSGVGRHRKPRRSMGVAGEFRPSERKYQEKPTCGASIGAFRDNEHLPPVSFGGTILVDGEPFGMTVHHMLDPPSDCEDDEEDCYSDEEGGLRRSMASRSTQDAAFRQIGGAAADLSFIGGDSTFSSPGIDISDEDLAISDDEDLSDTSTIRPDYSITDDSGHEFCSHTFGYIHASSGIRRVMRGQLKHEVDWALIHIEDDRLDVSNRLAGNYGGNRPRRPGRGGQHKSAGGDNKSNSPLLKLTKVVSSSKLSNLAVACRARSSGFSCGKISPAMCLVKLHGRHTFSYSWIVDPMPPQQPDPDTHRQRGSHLQHRQKAKPDLGTPGDSGAWIYCPETGELAGQVLAYGEKLRQCYIAPMDVLFEDIRARLGASRVELPGALSEAKLRGEEQRRESELAMAAMQQRQRGREEEQRAAADNEMRQDSGIGLDREVEMGLRELRLDERTQAERRVNLAARP